MKYLNKLIFENDKLKEIDKVVSTDELREFLESDNYCIRIGAIRKYEQLTGETFPNKTDSEAKMILQVDGFNKRFC